MPVAALNILPAGASSTSTIRKSSLVPEKKYKCQFCNRAFSRSEHRSRHERSHTKERPFKCMKCRSTFVRRDLLLRHDRTVHAKDGGIPLHSDVKRRAGPKASVVSGSAKSAIAIDASALEQIEASSDGLVDLETAAMLMTDLHHKATAAMRNAGVGPYENRPGMAFSHNGTPLMEPSVTYPSGAISLPQVPWDSFMPQSVTEPKSHSITSGASGSQDSQASYTSGSVVKLQWTRPRVTVYDRFIATVNGFHPQLSPIQPRSEAAAMRAPQVTGDEERNIILDNIRGHDSERAIPEGFRLPPLASLNRFLSTYFSLSHHHFFLLCYPSVLFYAFDQDHAYMMHIGSKVLVNQFLQNKENFSSRKCPLWTMQSSLLNMIFASWSGDPKGLEWACSIKSLLANMVAGNRYELKLRTDAREGAAPPDPNGWKMRAVDERTMRFNEFEDLQLPSTEAMWNLNVSDEATWKEHLKAADIPSFMDAHDNLFQGESLRYSAFATRVMINALFLEIWYHKRSPEALQDMVLEFKLRLALETWEKSLDLCEPEIVSVPLNAPHKGHPLIFNAMALFRNAKARLEVDLKSIQEVLRYHDSYEVAAAMSNARDKVKRSSEMIKVIQECYNCIETAAVQGIRWVARTSATNWSIEHPLCGLDLMVILSLWLYRLENDEEPPTEEETAMQDKIRALFDDDSVGYSSKLSSTVARVWGSMLDEVVVWGKITKLMGDSFRLHSQALVGYEDDMEVSDVSTPSMISQGMDDADDSVY
ncbi:C2H2 finger domain protein [Botrytis cinerea]